MVEADELKKYDKDMVQKKYGNTSKSTSNGALKTAGKWALKKVVRKASNKAGRKGFSKEWYKAEKNLPLKLHVLF